MRHSHTDRPKARTLIFDLTRRSLIGVAALLLVVLAIASALALRLSAVVDPEIASSHPLESRLPAEPSRSSIVRVGATRVPPRAEATAIAQALPAFNPNRPAVNAQALAKSPAHPAGSLPAATHSAAKATAVIMAKAQPSRPKQLARPQAATIRAAVVAATPQPKPRPRSNGILDGSLRWTLSTSPIRIQNDTRLVSSGTLIIEPGVEVLIDPGASLYVEGALFAFGTPEQPIRFVGVDNRGWESVIGTPGSNITLDYVDMHGGGTGGTLLRSDSGNLVIHHSHLTGNGGHIQATDSHVDIRNTELSNNDMPYGAALDITYTNSRNDLNAVILYDSRISANRLSAGAQPLHIGIQQSSSVIGVDIQRNLLIGNDSPNMEIFTNGQLVGNLVCNALINGSNGLSIHSDQPQTFMPLLAINNNAIEGHTPPIIPIYLEYGIGRGATSEIPLDLRNNWWESPSGPYAPDRNADGRGDAVGKNITFAPWLGTRPACAPLP